MWRGPGRWGFCTNQIWTDTWYRIIPDTPETGPMSNYERWLFRLPMTSEGAKTQLRTNRSQRSYLVVTGWGLGYCTSGYLVEFEDCLQFSMVGKLWLERKFHANWVKVLFAKVKHPWSSEVAPLRIGIIDVIQTGKMASLCKIDQHSMEH